MKAKKLYQPGFGGTVNPLTLIIVAENEKDREFLNSLNLGKDQMGEKARIRERLVWSANGENPRDDGPNPAWEALTTYVGMSPVDWAKAQI